MLITLLIVLYLISTVCAWKLVRGWIMCNRLEADFALVVLVLMPGINNVLCGVLIADRLRRRVANKDIKLSNKFFKL